VTGKERLRPLGTFSWNETAEKQNVCWQVNETLPREPGELRMGRGHRWPSGWDFRGCEK